MWFKNILRRSAPQEQSSITATSGKARLPGFLRPRTSTSQRHTDSMFVVDEAFLRRLERLNFQAQRMLLGNPASGEHPSRQRLPATIFSDHRPYSTGDDYRHVDWHAYARQEQVLVKLGEAEQDINVHLLLDCSRSMAWGTPSKLRVAQQLVSALGYLAMSRSDRVLVTPFGTTLQPSFGPAQSKNRLMELLRFIVAVKPGGQTALAHALGAYPAMHTRGGLIVICSDLLNEPSEDLAEALRSLPPPRWQVLVLHLLDPRELQPDLNGPLELEDTETGQRLQLTLDPESISIYKQNIATWQARLAETCARRGATYAQILTSWPLERAIVPYLRIRQIIK